MTYFYSLFSALALLIAFGSCATKVESERYVNVNSMGKIISTRTDTYFGCSVYLTVYEKAASIQQDLKSCHAKTGLMVHGRYEDKAVKPGEIYIFNKSNTVTYDFVIKADLDRDGTIEINAVNKGRQIWP